jgi:hypothetical protein
MAMGNVNMGGSGMGVPGGGPDFNQPPPGASQTFTAPAGDQMFNESKRKVQTTKEDADSQCMAIDICSEGINAAMWDHAECMPHTVRLMDDEGKSGQASIPAFVPLDEDGFTSLATHCARTPGKKKEKASISCAAAIGIGMDANPSDCCRINPVGMLGLTPSDPRMPTSLGKSDTKNLSAAIGARDVEMAKKEYERFDEEKSEAVNAHMYAAYVSACGGGGDGGFEMDDADWDDDDDGDDDEDNYVGAAKSAVGAELLRSAGAGSGSFVRVEGADKPLRVLPEELLSLLLAHARGESEKVAAATAPKEYKTQVRSCSLVVPGSFGVRQRGAAAAAATGAGLRVGRIISRAVAGTVGMLQPQPDRYAGVAEDEDAPSTQRKPPSTAGAPAKQAGQSRHCTLAGRYVNLPDCFFKARTGTPSPFPVVLYAEASASVLEVALIQCTPRSLSDANAGASAPGGTAGSCGFSRFEALATSGDAHFNQGASAGSDADVGAALAAAAKAAKASKNGGGAPPPTLLVIRADSDAAAAALQKLLAAADAKHSLGLNVGGMPLLRSRPADAALGACLLQAVDEAYVPTNELCKTAQPLSAPLAVGAGAGSFKIVTESGSSVPSRNNVEVLNGAAKGAAAAADKKDKKKPVHTLSLGGATTGAEPLGVQVLQRLPARWTGGKDGGGAAAPAGDGDAQWTPVTTTAASFTPLQPHLLKKGMSSKVEEAAGTQLEGTVVEFKVDRSGMLSVRQVSAGNVVGEAARKSKKTRGLLMKLVVLVLVGAGGFFAMQQMKAAACVQETASARLRLIQYYGTVAPEQLTKEGSGAFLDKYVAKYVCQGQRRHNRLWGKLRKKYDTKVPELDAEKALATAVKFSVPDALPVPPEIKAENATDPTLLTGKEKAKWERENREKVRQDKRKKFAAEKEAKRKAQEAEDKDKAKDKQDAKEAKEAEEVIDLDSEEMPAGNAGDDM